MLVSRNINIDIRPTRVLTIPDRDKIAPAKIESLLGGSPLEPEEIQFLLDLAGEWNRRSGIVRRHMRCDRVEIFATVGLGVKMDRGWKIPSNSSTVH